VDIRGRGHAALWAATSNTARYRHGLDNAHIETRGTITDIQPTVCRNQGPPELVARAAAEVPLHWAVVKTMSCEKCCDALCSGIKGESS